MPRPQAARSLRCCGGARSLAACSTVRPLPHARKILRRQFTFVNYMCQDLQAPWPAQKNRALVPAGLDGNEFSMLFRAGVPWWPDRAFELEHIVPEQEARFETDVWEERIKSYLAGKSKTTIL